MVVVVGGMSYTMQKGRGNCSGGGNARGICPRGKMSEGECPDPVHVGRKEASGRGDPVPLHVVT